MAGGHAFCKGGAHVRNLLLKYRPAPHHRPLAGSFLRPRLHARRGIYALVGRAAESLGNAIWLAFLAAMIAALLTGLSYACVGGRYAKAGGAAYVTQRACAGRRSVTWSASP